MPREPLTVCSRMAALKFTLPGDLCMHRQTICCLPHHQHPNTITIDTASRCRVCRGYTEPNPLLLSVAFGDTRGEHCSSPPLTWSGNPGTTQTPPPPCQGKAVTVRCCSTHSFTPQAWLVRQGVTYMFMLQPYLHAAMLTHNRVRPAGSARPPQVL